MGKREFAINTIMSQYPSLWKLTPPALDSWINDFIFEVCAEHNVGRRTAIDYVKIAMIKQKKEIQLNEKALSYEETKVMEAAL